MLLWKNINLFIQGGVSEDKLEEILSTFKNDVLSGIRLAGVAVGDTTSSNTCILVEHNCSPIKNFIKFHMGERLCSTI